MQRIFAVIVTYNIDNSFIDNFEVIKELVEEVVIVDNGSDEKTLKILSNLVGNVKIIYLENNMGIAYALNRGIEYSLSKGAQWVLTLDDDSRPTKKMISNMLELYDSLSDAQKEEIVMITPKHIEANEIVEADIENKYEYVLTEITSGALTKSSYYKDNKYYEELFIDLVDHDYCLNINRKGNKIIRVNSSILIHNLGESKVHNILGVKITPTNHSPIRRYYMMRNRLYIWHKYKKDFPEWILKDKIKCINEIVKIILFETDKMEKLKMIYKGKADYKKGLLGKLII